MLLNKSTFNSKVYLLKHFSCGSADSRTRRGSAVFKVNKPARNVSAERRAAPPQGKSFGEQTSSFPLHGLNSYLFLLPGPYTGKATGYTPQFLVLLSYCAALQPG